MASREHVGQRATRLLVVEDDPTLRELLAASLRFAGFEVGTAVDGEAALELAEREPPGLVVLDVMLPDIGGFQVLQRLRRAHGEDLPVVFLTARDSPDDKVDGLSAGGDDYVTKPFRLEELIARIHAVLRRSGRSSGRAAGSPLVVDDLELDPNAHLVTRGGERVELSQTEFKLLRYLMEHADQTVAKSRIVRDVWNYDFGGDPSIVESYVSYLRRKVDRGDRKLIHTVRGVGYVLRTPRT